jgi:hypothetical protein
MEVPGPLGDSTETAADNRRRKYRKMRVKFDETMNASNTLIKEEYKAMAVAARLQEQNECVAWPPPMSRC